MTRQPEPSQSRSEIREPDPSEIRRCPGCLWREGPPCASPVCGRLSDDYRRFLADQNPDCEVNDGSDR